MERKKLLITGCGRSGTLYAAEVWRRLGLDIRHERPIPHHGTMGEDGASSWLMAVNDPNPPFGASAADYEFEVTIHQVRHPLKVIASTAQFILAKGELAPNYIERNIPEFRLSPEEEVLTERQQLILQAARYWYHWNRLAEAKATLTVQLEQFEKALPDLCEMVGIDYQEEALESVAPNTNHRHIYLNEALWTVDWDELRSLDEELTDRIRSLAANYGYDS